MPSDNNREIIASVAKQRIRFFCLSFFKILPIIVASARINGITPTYAMLSQ